MWKGYSRTVATGEIFLNFPPESLQQEWEQLDIYAWAWSQSIIAFFFTPIACTQVSCSSQLLTSACLQDKLMFSAWFKLMSSEKAFPVSCCYLFKVWVNCGLRFVRKKRWARYKLSCLWSKGFFWMCIFGTNVLQLQAGEEHLVWWVRFNWCSYLISYSELLILLILLN